MYQYFFNGFQYSLDYSHCMLDYSINNDTTLEMIRNSFADSNLGLEDLLERERDLLAVVGALGCVSCEQAYMLLYMSGKGLTKTELAVAVAGLVERGYLDLVVTDGNVKTQLLTQSALFQSRYDKEHTAFSVETPEKIASHLTCVSLFLQLIQKGMKRGLVRFHIDFAEIVMPTGAHIYYIPCWKHAESWDKILFEKLDKAKEVCSNQSNVTLVFGCDSDDHMVEINRLLGGKTLLKQKPVFLQKRELLNGALELTQVNRKEKLPFLQAF